MDSDYDYNESGLYTVLNKDEDNDDDDDNDDYDYDYDYDDDDDDKSNGDYPPPPLYTPTVINNESALYTVAHASVAVLELDTFSYSVGRPKGYTYKAMMHT